MIRLSTIAREKIESLVGQECLYVPISLPGIDICILSVYGVGSSRVIIIPPSVCSSDDYLEMASYAVFLNNHCGLSSYEIIDILRKIQSSIEADEKFKLIPYLFNE